MTQKVNKLSLFLWAIFYTGNKIMKTAIALLIGLSAATQAGTLTDYRVIDGDTVHGYVDGEFVKIRMQCIDAPETYPSEQDYGVQSTATLRNLLAQGRVDFRAEEEDNYGRQAGYLFVNGRNINAEMVARGAAWNYAYYCGDEFAAEQRNAYFQGLGLWQNPNAIQPYCFRKNRDNDSCYYNPARRFEDQ